MGFDQIISSLPANIQQILQQLNEGGRSLNGRELLRLMSFLLASGEAYKATIMRALIWLANAGRISVPALVEASSLMAAGEGASIAASSGAAGAAGGMTAGAVAAAVAAVLAAILAAAFAYYMISTEIKTTIELPLGGLPCAVTAGPTGTVFTLTRSAIGSRTSLNKALAAAQSHADTSVNCSTSCTPPATCKPVAIVISAVPKYRVFWTTTVVTYQVGCACV